MMINGKCKTQMTKIPWPYSVMVSSCHLHCLPQTGLDLVRNGQVGEHGDLDHHAGTLYGTAGIAAGVMVGLIEAEQRGYTLEWAISTFAGVFSYLRLCPERTDLFSGFWLEDCGGLWCYRVL